MRLQSTSRKLFSMIVVIALCVTTLTATISPSYAGNEVSQAHLASLVVGQEDLPWDAVLLSSQSGKSPIRYTLEAFMGSSITEQMWCGPVSRPGRLYLPSPEYTVRLVVCIADSASAAVKIALTQVGSVAQPLPEATDLSNLKFADRAWADTQIVKGGSANVLTVVFVRSNVVALISMCRKGSFDSQRIREVANILGRRIDSAANGRPEVPRVLPPSTQEMKIDLEGAWNAKNVGAMLSGRRTRVALQKGSSTPKALPAKKIGKKDYLTPLPYVSGALGGGKVKMSKNTATVMLAGRSLLFTNGKSEVKIGNKTVRLAGEVVFKKGIALVPLSFLEAALGKQIAWQTKGSMVVAHL